MPPKRKAATAATEPRASRKSTRASADTADTSESQASTGRKRKTTDDSSTNKKKRKSDTKNSYPPGLDPSSFNQTRLLALFGNYADSDDPSHISPSGLEPLCNDCTIAMDGAQPLLLAYIMMSKKMGTFTQEEWIQGLAPLKIDTTQKLGLAVGDLDALLFHDTPIPTSPGGDPYNRNSFRTLERDVAFTEFYKYCHSLAKTGEQRNIDMETACALWTVLLVPRYPVASKLVAFLTDKPTYKGVTKDLWNMTFEFCKVIDEDLNGYDEEAAWPSMLDDFVAQEKQKSKDNVPSDERMEE